MKNIPDSIIRKISDAKQNNLKELDLSNSWGTNLADKLQDLPEILFELEQLEVLNLSEHLLTSLPESFSQLRNLKTLNLYKNEFTEIPDVLVKLQRLESLNIGSNTIRIPPWISQLEGLKDLDLSYTKLTSRSHNFSRLLKLNSLNLNGNSLDSIPDPIFNFKDLNSLSLGYNQLSSIAPEISRLSNLQTLFLNGNSITHLPAEISQLPNLKKLYLGDMSLEELPKWLESIYQLVALDISRNKLNSIPDWLFRLTKLEELGLDENKFSTFPEQISDLNELKTLSLSKCNLNIIPPSLRDLLNLEDLTLIDNNIEIIPEWMSQLTKIKDLNLSGNNLTHLPEVICKLSNLQILWMYGSNLHSIAPSMGELQNLSSLSLGGNFLETLPDSFSQLKNLTLLYLDNNNFDSIPEVIYEITSLEHLKLSNSEYEKYNRNKIKSLSSRILQLKSLRDFQVENNPMETPPPEVVAQGLDAIKSYFRQLEVEGVDYLYEAKLLVVGEGGAGKTSLSRKILDPNFKLAASEKSTEGIEVNEWRFEMDEGQSFRVNIWDFGGQEIYHATHQFFLTKRSLYLLVADTRKEDTDFYYWLNAVDLLTDGSPILVIKNEKQDRHREINERQLRGQFSNLKETLSTNLATNRGLEEILIEIKHYISKLPHVGTPLPKTWVKVREVLENNPHDYIDLQEYLKICEQNGFSRLEDKLQLSGYLHDLGVCLHFQEDPILKKVIILKPKWGTDAVYRVLDSKTVIGNLGKFNLHDLSVIWNDKEYENMQAELLQLMINFRLCYKLPDSELYIAPQLLSENQPPYDWNEADNLILRYTYEFMPKGIITRFIVTVNTLISRQNLVWKSGVVLENAQTIAEIIEYYDKREIKIRIAGKHKKELITIVTYELDKIHSSYNRLKYSKLIPCNCNTCRNLQEPYFYSYDTLQKFIGDKQYDIQCQISYQMVSVSVLIDDVMGGTPLNFKMSDAGYVFNAPVETVVIQHHKDEDKPMKEKEEMRLRVRSAWANGSFYLFTFAVVIAGLGVLARSVPGYTLGIILVAGILFIPIIGGLQLRQDERLSEKSFLELIGISMAQLPLIGKLVKVDKSGKNAKDHLKP